MRPSEVDEPDYERACMILSMAIDARHRPGISPRVATLREVAVCMSALGDELSGKTSVHGRKGTLAPRIVEMLKERRARSRASSLSVAAVAAAMVEARAANQREHVYAAVSRLADRGTVERGHMEGRLRVWLRD
jgi:hypothetical protein